MPDRTTITAQHPLVKAASYCFIGILVTVLQVWSPSESLIICSVAFAVDGLVSSLLAFLNDLAPGRSRIVGFIVPLGSLLVARGLATYLGVV